MAASTAVASDASAQLCADPIPPLTGPSQVVGPARWPRLMDRITVAEYLSVSPRHVDTLVKQGLIPPAKVRPSVRLVRWDRADVDAALDRASTHRSVPGRSFDDILAPALVGPTRVTKSGSR
jgi:predicted DNA-binding transcriptional regulator AlpA